MSRITSSATEHSPSERKIMTGVLSRGNALKKIILKRRKPDQTSLSVLQFSSMMARAAPRASEKFVPRDGRSASTVARS